ncbi:hypothetical protein DPMN_101236 [Dreissena polymorpha]|uniref:Uncharacterized protein n=1 Tax=Dreissena polymorpha TaxID=45954 RepID=A0A9D4LHB5_DREPO|nr:hypothetical protein DPMN_101236 [Dreissena polymorpha]
MYQSERTLDQQTIYFIIGGIRDSRCITIESERFGQWATPHRLCGSPFNRDTSDNSAISAIVCGPLSDAFRLDRRYGGIVRGFPIVHVCGESIYFRPSLWNIFLKIIFV